VHVGPVPKLFLLGLRAKERCPNHAVILPPCRVKDLVSPFLLAEHAARRSSAVTAFFDLCLRTPAVFPCQFLGPRGTLPFYVLAVDFSSRPGLLFAAAQLLAYTEFLFAVFRWRPVFRSRAVISPPGFVFSVPDSCLPLSVLGSTGRSRSGLVLGFGRAQQFGCRAGQFLCMDLVIAVKDFSCPIFVANLAHEGL
jgi:hypothetical protein